MNQRYHHLALSERENIMILVHKDKSVTEIAQCLNRSKSTISRELRRNTQLTGYSAHQAQESYQQRRTKSKRSYKLDNPDIAEYVNDKFHNHQWSPEQISGRIKQENPGLEIGTYTIYRGIDDGRLDRPEDTCLTHRKLRHRGKRRHSRNHVEKRGKIQITNDISERPLEADLRKRIGDWEADTVIGVNGKACLVTLVDRKSRYLIAAKAERKDSDSVSNAIILMLQNHPIHSITPDRGKEFAKHQDITAALNGVPFYFPPPHQPWQRGTNENTNGLLREYFPKSKDISPFSEEYIQSKVDELNNRPRKCLGYKTPAEVYYSELLHLH